MGKKIIKLTESELYNLVKKVLQEQEEKEEEIDESFYKLGSKFYFKINQNYLYSIVDGADGQQWTYVNGDLYNFKVNNIMQFLSFKKPIRSFKLTKTAFKGI